jgi:hypothetical protein
MLGRRRESSGICGRLTVTDSTLEKLKELAHIASLERKRRGTSLYCCIICAQPEHDERCPIWVAMQAAYTLGLSQGQWIPVGERLPERSTLVWSWNALYPRAILSHLDSCGLWCGHYTDALQCEMRGPLPTVDPTHWQPLPEPPKAVKNGD